MIIKENEKALYLENFQPIIDNAHIALEQREEAFVKVCLTIADLEHNIEILNQLQSDLEFYWEPSEMGLVMAAKKR